MARKPTQKKRIQAAPNHGGARAGAGRKPKEVTRLRDELIQAFENKNAEFLSRGLENLVYLANGGYQRVEEEWSVDPEEPGSEPVLTKRKVSVAEPDRAANQYLIDRMLGKPDQSLKHKGADGGPVSVVLEDLIEKVWGDHTPCDSAS